MRGRVWMSREHGYYYTNPLVLVKVKMRPFVKGSELMRIDRIDRQTQVGQSVETYVNPAAVLSGHIQVFPRHHNTTPAIRCTRARTTLPANS